MRAADNIPGQVSNTKFLASALSKRNGSGLTHNLDICLNVRYLGVNNGISPSIVVGVRMYCGGTVSNGPHSIARGRGMFNDRSRHLPIGS